MVSKKISLLVFLPTDSNKMPFIIPIKSTLSVIRQQKADIIALERERNGKEEREMERKRGREGRERERMGGGG